MENNGALDMAGGSSLEPDDRCTKPKLNDFELIKLLGEGAYGKVHLATLRGKGQVYALKSINLDDIDEMQVNMEIHILREISSKRCPYVVKMYGSFFQDKVAYLILENVMGGTLFSKMSELPLKRFDEANAAKYIKQIAQALEAVHMCLFIHCDLKPENVLLSNDGSIRLADFGSAWFKSVVSGRRLCGTVEYSAPEIIEGKHYDHRVDLWSLGVLIFELIVGRSPFESQNDNATRDNILSGIVRFPVHVSMQARDVINKLLVRKQEKRISIDSVLNHKWVTENCNTNQ